MRRIATVLVLLAFAFAGARGQDAKFEGDFASWYGSVLRLPRENRISEVGSAYVRFANPRLPMEKDRYKEFIAMCEKYMYDPNSPMRDEDLWGLVASMCADDRRTPENMRGKYRSDALLCSRNAVGTKAADFKWQDSRGRFHTLYGVSAEYTILFFSNPGCTACKEIIGALSDTKAVDDKVRDGRIAVVNIYVDEDLDAWREYLGHYPSYWSTGYDPSFAMRDNNVYHIRAIPSVYLLSSDKTVIFKDVPLDRLMDYLLDL